MAIEMKVDLQKSLVLKALASVGAEDDSPECGAINSPNSALGGGLDGGSPGLRVQQSQFSKRLARLALSHLVSVDLQGENETICWSSFFLCFFLSLLQSHQDLKGSGINEVKEVSFITLLNDLLAHNDLSFQHGIDNVLFFVRIEKRRNQGKERDLVSVSKFATTKKDKQPIRWVPSFCLRSRFLNRRFLAVFSAIPFLASALFS